MAKKKSLNVRLEKIKNAQGLYSTVGTYRTILFTVTRLANKTTEVIFQTYLGQDPSHITRFVYDTHLTDVEAIERLLNSDNSDCNLGHYFNSKVTVIGETSFHFIPDLKQRRMDNGCLNPIHFDKKVR